MTTQRQPLVASILGLAIVAMATRPALAAYDAYVTATNTDGSTVVGDSTVDDHVGQIEALDFSVNATHQTRTTGGQVLVGPDSLSPFAFTTNASTASTTLILDALRATPLKSVQVDVYNSAGGLATTGPLVSWTISNPYITTYRSASGDEGVGETYVLGAYSEAKYTFNDYTAGGMLQGTRTIDWKITTPGQTYPVTTTTGSVPDYQFLNVLQSLAIEPGIAGPVTGFTTPEPATLGSVAAAALVVARRRRRD